MLEQWFSNFKNVLDMSFKSYFDVYYYLFALACITAVVTLLCVRARLFHRTGSSLGNVVKSLGIALIFGVLSCLATDYAVQTGAVKSNIRDLAPLVAGLAGGPLAGIASGLIGGIYRYLAYEGFTQYACTVSAILAGAGGGLIHYLNKHNTVKAAWGLLIGIVMEAVHMGLTVLFAQFSEQSVQAVRLVFVPMAVVTAVGLTLCLYIVHLNKGVSRSSRR